MQIKHIRWIAVIGLLAIIELQYVWLVNTYKLTKESIQMKSDELLRCRLPQTAKKVSTCGANGSLM